MEDNKLKEFEDRLNGVLMQHGEIIANLTLRISSLEKVLIESKVVDTSQLVKVTNEICEIMNKSIVDAIEQFKLNNKS
jgi:hypothetical protein